MFENLTGRLGGTVKKLRGQARLSEENIQGTLREVRMALLEADVALPVVREFIDRVKQKALGQEVLQSLSPGQSFIKVVHDELIHLMGDANEELTLAAQPPVVILVAGLQGSGKTTSVAKLSRWLSEQRKKSVAVTSCDVYRPAAIDQLKTLAQQVGAEFIPSESSEKPVDIARRALDHVRKQFRDVLLIDTAGRLHVDDDMMREISALHAAVQPTETLFVVDSMSGQDAAVSAQAFNDALPLTGVVLTKTDGDARGGAALSVREITGKPIKFLGTGEKVTALEPFHPERIASRILGMGDVVSLVEKVEQEVDRAQAHKLARKIKKGRGFDLVDLKNQLEQMMNMGGLSSLVDKIPGTAGMVPQNAKALADEKMLPRMIAIISSMTPHERRFPDVIKNARKRRIAAGSGTQVQDVNRLLKQHMQMKKMMKKASRKGGLQRMMQAMQGKAPPPH